MSSLSPAAPASRLLLLDALRGLALCGILLVNIFRMGGPIAMERPLSAPGLGDGDWQVWIIAQLFLTGTMRGLFSLLFGVGLILFVERSGGRTKLFRRRLLLLLLFGVIDSTLLLWPGDILIIYAAAGLLVLPLYWMRVTWLFGAAGLILVLISIWGGVEAHGTAPAATVYTSAMLDREGDARLGDYGQLLGYMSRVSVAWTFGQFSLRWIGDAAAMMLIGMAMYRKGLFEPTFDRQFMLWMTLAGYAFGLTLRCFDVVLIMTNDGAPTFVSALIDQPGRLAMTLGHVGLFQLLWHRFAAPHIKAALAMTGRMALTLYLGQSLIAAFIFSGFGLGLWNCLAWPALWSVAIAIFAVETLFALVWFSAFRYGPAEWLWRWATYGTGPRLLKHGGKTRPPLDQGG